MPSLPLCSQKLKKAKQHVAAQKAPKPKQAKSLLKTFPLGSSSSSAIVSGFISSVKPTVKVKKPKKDVVAKLIAGADSSSTPPPHGAVGGGSTSAILGGAVIPLHTLPEGGSTINGDPNTGQTGLKPVVEQGLAGMTAPGERRAGEGLEVPKPPPVLPDNLPEQLLAKIQTFEEVCVGGEKGREVCGGEGGRRCVGGREGGMGVCGHVLVYGCSQLKGVLVFCVCE